MDLKPLRLPSTVPVSGTSFRQEELRDVVEGDVLDVVAVDDNTHDANAVEVRTRQGVLVGFVPRNLAPRLRATGESTWPARVEEVLRGQTWGLRIAVHPSGDQLSSAREKRAAALARGERHIISSEPAELDPFALAETVPAGGDAEVVDVVSPSGRVLGVLKAKEGDRVVVIAPSGETSYPSHVVTLRARKA